MLSNLFNMVKQTTFDRQQVDTLRVAMQKTCQANMVTGGASARGFFMLNHRKSNPHASLRQNELGTNSGLTEVGKRDFARNGSRGKNGGKDDFYSTLGVEKSASQSDIKKSYFQMAKKYHPDVNKTPEAKEKFAKINNAYETLSDENKRRVYDQTGMTGDE